jgi:hypothetical protein
MSDINSFIKALEDNKTGDANNEFASIMSSKINDVLNTKKIEIADRVFNGMGQEDAEFQSSEIESD